MKIWLDDVRPAPKGYLWVKDYESFVAVVECMEFNFISFDHDLGEEKTGYDCAKLIEELAYEGRLKRIGWQVHSANPSGAINIQIAMEQAEKYWERD